MAFLQTVLVSTLFHQVALYRCTEFVLSKPDQTSLHYLQLNMNAQHFLRPVVVIFYFFYLLFYFGEVKIIQAEINIRFPIHML